MKAILLAAGRGTRISKRIKEIPKCTLPVGGKPLIRYTAEMMVSIGISPVVCVGYGSEKICEALENLDVKYYTNPFYDITNSIASLWFTKEELNDDMIIMNADVFISDDFFNAIINNKHDVVMAVDRTKITAGDFFLSTNNDYVKKYGKDLPVEERSCEYIGIAKIAKSFVNDFKNRLTELIQQQRHSYWWENVLYSFVDNNEKYIYTIDVDGMFWSEIDSFDDYERILNYYGGK